MSAQSDYLRHTESTQQIISNGTTPANRKSRRPLSHDWVVFLSVVMVMCNDLGLLFAFGAVFPYILEEFQESRASTTAIQSIFFGVGQGSGILTGLLVRRFGPRKIGFAGATLYSAGLIVSMFATSTVYMHVSYGLISGGAVMILLNYVTSYAAGLSRGIIVSCQSIVSLRMLGTTNYSTGLGMILFVSGVFSVSSGPLHGFLRDVSGSYFISLNGTAGVFVLSMFLSLIAMKLHSRIKRRQKDITVDIPEPVFTITRL